MEKLVTGLHHVTAITSDAQKNLDFYAGILGLRLVKKTINFDSPDIYHLYYGNEKGSPGTILTFFAFPHILKGKKGKGQVTVTSFSIPENSVDYWIKRFKKFKVAFQSPQPRFEGETVIYFEDFDGLGLELVAQSHDQRPPFSYGNIPLKHSIIGFHSIALSEECHERTAHLLTSLMDYKFVAEKENRTRFSVDNKPGQHVDLLCVPDLLQGQGGTGTVHHVAFATPNEDSQLQAREKLVRGGLNVTPVLDRQYFHSVYYREPGGVLFEIATVPPGFAVDETLAHLGEDLKLPPWEEGNRQILEKLLPPLHLQLSRFED